MEGVPARNGRAFRAKKAPRTGVRQRFRWWRLLASYPSMAWVSAARARRRVESRVGSGEFSSLRINGISVQPRITASHPSPLSRRITVWK
ncbi:hypothetical protein D3C80_1586360 [compost metagenome]